MPNKDERFARRERPKRYSSRRGMLLVKWPTAGRRVGKARDNNLPTPPLKLCGYRSPTKRTH